jgi:hypothetical protein
MKNLYSLETIITAKQASPTEIYEATYIIPFAEFIQTEDDINKFTNHLLSLAEEIPPNEEKLLFYFFQTSLNYLKDFYNKKNHNMQTLGLLAAFLINYSSCDEPLYDQFLKESLQKSHLSKHQITRKFYKQFLELRDENSGKVIEKHFWKIVGNYYPPIN